MASGTASIDQGHPAGFPRAVGVGRVLNLSFFVPGIELDGDIEVFWKERPRARVIPGPKPRPQLYTPDRTKKWEAHVGEHALAQLRAVEVEGFGEEVVFTMPIRECRILASMRFNIRKPKSYPKRIVHSTKKPDLDNLVKAVLDGIVEAKVIEDDNAVTDLLSYKRYADEEHPIGVEVDLTCLPL